MLIVLKKYFRTFALHKDTRIEDFLIASLRDDLVYLDNGQKAKISKAMIKEFEMIDLGLMRYLLSIQVKQKNGRLSKIC